MRGRVVERGAVQRQLALAVDEQTAAHDARRVVNEVTVGDVRAAALHAHGAALANQRHRALAAVGADACLVLRQTEVRTGRRLVVAAQTTGGVVDEAAAVDVDRLVRQQQYTGTRVHGHVVLEGTAAYYDAI